LNYTVNCQKYSETSNLPQAISFKTTMFQKSKTYAVYSLFVKSSRMKRRLKLFVYKVDNPVLCLRLFMEQELPTHPEHLRFNEVGVARSLIVCVMFSRLFLWSFFVFPLGCLSFDLQILITLWYLQTLQSVCLYCV
jgi:hypothetical protein